MVGWHPAPSSGGGAWRNGAPKAQKGRWSSLMSAPRMEGSGGHMHATSRGAGKGPGRPSGEAVMGQVAVEAGSPRLWAANPCPYC